MQKESKVLFSEEELQLLFNTEFFELKKNVTEKMIGLFNQLQLQMKSLPLHRQFDFPKGCETESAKISKGENFKGLPYLMMDFPRLFNRENVFAFRSMMWWGHYYSFTLHISGEQKEAYKDRLLLNIESLTDRNIYFCVDQSEWNHDIQSPDYILIDAINLPLIKNLIQEKPFIKLAAKFELSDLKNLMENGKETYSLFLQSLQ